MSTTSETKSVRKTRSTRPDCCSDPDCGSGLRNNYFFGKQLSPHSFQVEQRHLLDRRRLLNRAIHGWGVVYGFEVEALSGTLLIKPGFALDHPGRELLQTDESTYTCKELIVRDENGQRSDCIKIREAECWLLSAHYAEQGTDKVKVSDACHCERQEWNYTCETVRYSLKPIDCNDCCKGQGCDWKCECGSEGRCKPSDDTRQRGGRCLCDHVTDWSPKNETDLWCEIDEPCGRVRVDLHNGVPLACVTLKGDDCGNWTIGEVDTCAPQRMLVKRNDLLFDLIQGCDLTRITEIGWKDWHRSDTSIDFRTFSEALGGYGEGQDEYITKAFWVKFSRPVRENTLKPDCFAMTVLSAEHEGGWWQTFRVPILRIDTTLERQTVDPPGLVRSARIVIDGRWLEDAVRGRRTLFYHGETRIEIEIRGDLIVDCNGQTVDANGFGLSPFPTGNGTPGGTFFSSFQVNSLNENTKRAAD